MGSEAYKLGMAKNIALSLKIQLETQLGDEIDQELFEAVIESETDVFELVGKLAREAIQAETMAEAVDKIMADNRVRRDRIRNRAEKLREAVKTGLTSLGVRSRAYPDLSLSISDGRGDICFIPQKSVGDDYLVTKVSPDLKKIREALENGEKLGFAELGPNKLSLTIRTK